MLFSKETMLAYAHSKGISNIEDEALKVLSQDLEYRIKELCQEAAKIMTASKRTKLAIDDINYALQSRNVDPLFGYDPNETLFFRTLPPNIFYVPDREIDLEEFLNHPLPKIPLKTTIQSHWLVIEGVQPQIPQNPLIKEREEIKKDTLLTLAEEAELKQQNKHVLSKEMQLYFDKIISIIKGDQKEVAIECLLNESGLQQLIPYFIQYFNETILKSLKEEEALKTIIVLYYSLIRNKFIFIDPYLHQILPSLLTCIIGKNIDSDEVRRMASEVVKYIYEKFSRTYKTLAPRILNTLSKAWLDKERSGDSQYGALFCLSVLSDNVVEIVIKKHAEKYKEEIGNEKVLNLLREILKR